MLKMLGLRRTTAVVDDRRIDWALITVSGVFLVAGIAYGVSLPLAWPQDIGWPRPPGRRSCQSWRRPARGDVAFSVGLMVLLLSAVDDTDFDRRHCSAPRRRRNRQLRQHHRAGRTGGFIASVLFLAAAMVVGYAGGGSDASMRSVLGLGTAQRNLSAAPLVAGQNFSDTPGVLTFIIVGWIVGLILLLPAAGEIGKRAIPDVRSSRPTADASALGSPSTGEQRRSLLG